MKKLILIFIGHLSIFLGVLGIFLPVLPTTPFLLLAATCYLNSSTKFYNWLINHKVFGPYLKEYMKHKAIPVKIKAFAIITMWLFIGVSITFLIDPVPLKIMLLIIAVGVTIHLLRIKNLTDEMRTDDKPDESDTSS